MRKRAYFAKSYILDMVRYSGVEPIVNNLGFVFIKPSNLNFNWVKAGVERTRSFGVYACPGWWNDKDFEKDWKVPKSFLPFPPYKNL